jgi:hypothetical protein
MVVATKNATALRPNLGDFSSIVCFKAVVVGVEQALGAQAARVALLQAGRARGRQVAEEAGLAGRGSVEGAAEVLDGLIGASGTRLCRVESVAMVGDVVKVRLQETVCSAGEPEGSPRKLSFTLGAVQGAVEAVLGVKLKPEQTESVLRGGTCDEVTLTKMG